MGDQRKPLSELHIGRAGEHLVAADLMINGYECFHAAQGMPYDLVADIDGRLLKVQVKTTAGRRRVPQRKGHIPAYLFWVNRCGKGGLGGYEKSGIDLFALVSLEERVVGYLPGAEMARTLVVRVEALRGTYTDEVLGVRNTALASRLAAGEDAESMSVETGLDRSYLHRLKNGKGYRAGAGVYLSDLSLMKAIDGKV